MKKTKMRTAWEVLGNSLSAGELGNYSSLIDMLPVDHEIVTLNDAPETVVNKIKGRETNPILCLDARQGSLDSARNWLEAFQAISYEKEMEGELIPLPHKVVFLADAFQSVNSDVFREHLSVDWISAGSDCTDLWSVYIHQLVEDIKNMSSALPENGTSDSQKKVAKSTPIEDFLSPEEKLWYRQRVLQIQDPECY